MAVETTLTFDVLTEAVRKAAAFRVVQSLQPAGGKGARVFPSTYGSSQDGKDKERFGETKYCTEKRLVNGRVVDCVLLDSVASQANRFELALRDGWDAGELDFPLIRIDFGGTNLPEPIEDLSTLEAPHRCFDAILRDSVDASDVLFRNTAAGKAVTAASTRDAVALYQYCPTALVLGSWDSTGPKGGLGSKFPRALASEIVAIDAVLGARVQSRIDPLQITKVMDVVYKRDGGQDWDLTPADKKAKAVAPSEVNHGNVAPSRDVTNGGITFDHARQTAVLSLPALRRLKFPRRLDGAAHADRGAAEQAARVNLAALGLAGLLRAQAEGYDLRSGTLLVAEGPQAVEVVYGDGRVQAFALDADGAADLLRQANAAAAALGLGWSREPIPALRPAKKLVHLLRRSQEEQAKKKVDAGEGA